MKPEVVEELLKSVIEDLDDSGYAGDCGEEFYGAVYDDKGNETWYTVSIKKGAPTDK
jgi:hypothetical protein